MEFLMAFIPWVIMLIVAFLISPGLGIVSLIVAVITAIVTLRNNRNQ